MENQFYQMKRIILGVLIHFKQLCFKQPCLKCFFYYLCSRNGLNDKDYGKEYGSSFCFWCSCGR